MGGFRTEWKEDQVCISEGGVCQPPSPAQLCNTRNTFHNGFSGVVQGHGRGSFTIQARASHGLSQHRLRGDSEVEASGLG